MIAIIIYQVAYNWSFSTQAHGKARSITKLHSKRKAYAETKEKKGKGYGYLPQDQSGSQMKEQSAEVVLDGQLHMLADHHRAWISFLKKEGTKTTAYRVTFINITI